MTPRMTHKIKEQSISKKGIFVGRYSGRVDASGSSPGGVAPRAAAAATGEVFPRPRLVGRVSTASPCRPGKHLGIW
jgi:hypothetical protein